MNLTVDDIRRAVGCTPALAAVYGPHLIEACRHYRIDTRDRLAAFLANLGHESGSFRYATEIADGSAYEGRQDLGNTQPGDGPRYRGRGLIQTTGRYNYRAVTDRLRGAHGPSVPDFESEPERLAEPRWAAWSAADYWDWKGLSKWADAGEIVKVGRAINRGNANSSRPANGEEDRLMRWRRALEALPAPIENRTAPEEKTVSKAADILTNPATGFLLAAVNPLLAVVPEIAKLFMDKKGTTVPERNVAAAVKLVEVAQKALETAGTPAPNAQAVVEAVQADPAAREVVRQAVLSDPYWLMAETGGGGIDGARKHDLASQAANKDGPWWAVFRSPSFIVAIPLLAIVIMIVGAVVGLWGEPFSDEVRSAIANGIPMLILGGLIGYYYGQTTSRNRTPSTAGSPGE